MVSSSLFRQEVSAIGANSTPASIRLLKIFFLIVIQWLKWLLFQEFKLYTAIHGAHKVNATDRSAMFIVDNKYYFDVKEKVSVRDTIRPTAIGELEYGRGNQLPLWLLGFLY